MKTRKINRKYHTNLYNIVASKVVITENTAKHSVDEYLRNAMKKAHKERTKAPEDAWEAYVELVNELVQNTAYTVILKNKLHEAVIKNGRSKAFALGYTHKGRTIRLIMTDNLYNKCETLASAYHHINDANKKLHNTIEVTVDESDVITDILKMMLA